MRRPTIADVARRAGVSKATVSFAFNGRERVAPETYDRIVRAAAELGWQPSHRARSLSVSRAFAIGLVVARPPELLGGDPFFPSFIAGVETALAPAGQSLVLQVVASGEAEEAGYRKFAAEGRVDGVLVTDLRHDDRRVALLEELGLTAVTVNRPDVASPFPAVCMDDEQGVREAVEHLVALGHERIAHVSGPMEFLHSRHRRDAWATAMQDAGLRPTLEIAADFTAAGGSAATVELLDGPEPPTAVVYANDVMAIAGISVAHTRGLRVPRDLSVVGFDGIELGSHIHPPLTTVTTNPLTWGRVAAEILLRATDPAASETPEDVELPPAQLEVRDSTARPAGPRRPRRARTATD